MSPLDIDGTGYLVSPYGEVAWVQNVRVEPRVRLRHGREDRAVRLMELNREQAAKLLLAYWTREKVTRPYFDVGPAPSLADFKAETIPHPVFRIIV